MEKWKDVVGYEGHFMVSESGKVKSLNRICIRRDGNKFNVREKNIIPFISNVGYTRVALQNNGKQVKYSVHRLVAEAFIPKEIGRDFVNHIDGNRLNNHYSNLEWVSMIENNCHRFDKTKTTSKYTGVSWIKAKQKFTASICINKIQKTIGHYLTEEEAYAARCDYELKNGIINKYL
jgi:hypothetical protein